MIDFGLDSGYAGFQSIAATVNTQAARIVEAGMASSQARAAISPK
jgi:hypothetical protein